MLLHLLLLDAALMVRIEQLYDSIRDHLSLVIGIEVELAWHAVHGDSGSGRDLAAL